MSRMHRIPLLPVFAVALAGFYFTETLWKPLLDDIALMFGTVLTIGCPVSGLMHWLVLQGRTVLGRFLLASPLSDMLVVSLGESFGWSAAAILFLALSRWFASFDFAAAAFMACAVTAFASYMNSFPAFFYVCFGRRHGGRRVP